VKTDSTKSKTYSALQEYKQRLPRTANSARWTIYYVIEILPLIAVAVLVLVIQIHLNFRLIQNLTREKITKAEYIKRVGSIRNRSHL
jgi:hypothetical protein